MKTYLIITTEDEFYISATTRRQAYLKAKETLGFYTKEIIKSVTQVYK
jgi:hypothetical protein